MCTEPCPILRGCHHFFGASLSACARMYRTIVRVTKNVRRKAIRHHISGTRPGGIARSKLKSVSHSSSTGKRYLHLDGEFAQVGFPVGGTGTDSLFGS